jgi:hypothetical protein
MLTESHLNKITYFKIEHAFYFGLFLVSLLCVFLFFPVERSIANSHDYLDHWFSFYSIWGRIPESSFDLNFMIKELDGHPLNALAFSEFNFSELMYRLFPPILAHSVIASFISIVAFIGVFLLLKDYFIDKRTIAFVVLIFALSLFFSFLPHKTIRVLGSAGVPLFIWAIFNIINNKKQFFSFILISLSPFFVYLPYGGLTNLIVIFLLWAWLFFTKHNSAKKIFFLMMSLVLTYVVVAYRSIYHLFFSEYEYDSTRNYRIYSDLSSFDLSNFLSEWGYNLLYVPGQHHTTGINNNIMIFIWIIISMAILVSLVHIFIQNNKDYVKDIKITFLLFIFVSIASALKIFDLNYQLLHSLIGIPLQLQRIDVLSLTFITIMCAISFKSLLMIDNRKIHIFVMIILLFLPVISLSYAYGLRHQIQETFDIDGFSNFRTYFSSSDLEKKYSIKNTNISDGRHRNLEFTRIVDYFEIDAFDKIKNDLLDKKIMMNFSEYGTLSIGISPSVAWYHGFRTFDGRFYDASMKKVLKVKKIYASEYKKDSINIDNLMKSRSYISKHSLEKDGSISPGIDIDFFTKMNGKVIFSLYPLKNSNELGVELFGTYKGTVDSIYVYIVNTNKSTEISY